MKRFVPLKSLSNMKNIIVNYLTQICKKIDINNANVIHCIVEFAYKLLEQFITMDNSHFISKDEMSRYIYINSVTCLWLSHKFNIDDDDINAKELEQITNIPSTTFIKTEKNILEIINYKLYTCVE